MNSIMDYLEGQLVIALASVRLKPIITQIPGFKFDRTTQNCWNATANLLSATVAVRVFEGKLDCTQNLIEYCQQEQAKIDQLNYLRSGAANDFLPGTVSDGLWEPQKSGAAFLATARYAYLCDKVGAGKTAQIIRALKLQAEHMDLDVFPALVVCKKTAMLSWIPEAEKWDPSGEDVNPEGVDYMGTRVFVAAGSADRRRKVIEGAKTYEGRALLIINWEGLKNHSRLIAFGGKALTEKQIVDGELQGDWIKSVIADEAHKAKSWEAACTRALWQIAHRPNIINRWAVTATPISGECEDLWAIGHFVDPDAFAEKGRYMNRYTIQVPNFYGGVDTMGWNEANLPELLDYFKGRFLHRTLEDMRGADYKGVVPPIIKPVSMSGKQLSTYRKMVKDGWFTDGKVIMAAKTPMERRMRLLQFAAATPVIEEYDGFDEFDQPCRLMKIARLDTPSCKVDAMFDILDEVDEPIVLFTQSRLLLDLCAREIEKHNKKHGKTNPITYGVVAGGLTEFETNAAIASFQAGNLDIILCSYGAAAESITLNKSALMVRLQWTDNAVHFWQAPGRLARGTQDRVVRIIDVITQDTAEELIHANLDEKGKLADTVTGLEESLYEVKP